jgi:anti-sigma factor RsiW
MTVCGVQLSGAIDLYFYEELPPDKRREIERHVRRCSACRDGLAELALIRSSLAALPEIAAPAGGDWTRLMARIEAAIAAPAQAADPRTARVTRPRASARFAIAGLALAAAVTVITAATAHVVHKQAPASITVASHPAMRPPSPVEPAGLEPAGLEPAGLEPAGLEPAGVETAVAQGPEAGLAAVSEQHFERSRLVILGLTARDPRRSSLRDWEYERRMAGSLLDDTRLYKQAAAERGMTSLARVMSDLELVLLQTSLADRQDPATLARLQRLIRKRDLVTRMDVAWLGDR